MPSLNRLLLHALLRPIPPCALVWVGPGWDVRVCRLVHKQRNRYPDTRPRVVHVDLGQAKRECRISVNERDKGRRVVRVPKDDKLARETGRGMERRWRHFANDVTYAWVCAPESVKARSDGSHG